VRKSAILLALAWLLLFPVAAQAQAAITFEQFDVQLWPEYDQPAVLVIYDFVVSAETSLPAQVNIRMPAGAQLLAVARGESGGLMNQEHDQPRREGNYDVVSFTISDRSLYHVEFYIPYTREGNKRSFIFTWPGDYAVSRFSVSMQEPVEATQIETEPNLVDVAQGQDGFIYRKTTLAEIAAGQSQTFKISYEKANETLSATSLGVQPTAPLDQPVSGQSAFMSMLPWILGGVGLALIVGGGIWYWLSGRSSSGSSKSRRRHASQAEEGSEAQVYCSQCGKRAQASDRFCRACGSRLRAAE